MATSPNLVSLLTKEMTGRALLAELESNHPKSVELIEKLKRPTPCNPGENYTGPTFIDIFTGLLQQQDVKDAFEPLREQMPASTLAARSFLRVQFNAAGTAAGASDSSLKGLRTVGLNDLEGKVMTASLTMPLAPSMQSDPADFTLSAEEITIGQTGTYAIEAMLLPLGRCEDPGNTAPTFNEATAFDYRMFMVVLRPTVSNTVPFHVSEILAGTVTRVNLQNAAANGNQASLEFLKSYANTLHFLQNDKVSFVVQRGRNVGQYPSTVSDALMFPKTVDAMGPTPTRDLYNYVDFLRIE